MKIVKIGKNFENKRIKLFLMMLENFNSFRAIRFCVCFWILTKKIDEISKKKKD